MGNLCGLKILTKHLIGEPQYNPEFDEDLVILKRSFIFCDIQKLRARTTHNDLWKQDSLKLSATSIILKRAKSECNCESKGTELILIHTYSTRIHTHTHTCPFPLLQLYNLNARDSLTKTSWAHLVIAVYSGMLRNSFIHYHVELMACVSAEMKHR